MIDLSIGWQFDLAVLVSIAIFVGLYRLLVLWTGQPDDQRLAESQRPSFPSGTHEGDWNWPSRQDAHRLR